jgi:tetratricopeptide (TPR) repeat protein
MHRTRIVLFAAALLAASTLTRVVAAGSCPPSTATGLYADARRAFVEKRYDDSIALLRKAYACDPNPVYLGNIARAYEESSRPREALSAWREYHDLLTDPKERTQVEGRISALSKVVDDLDRLEREKREADEARRRAENKPPPPPPKPPPPERHVSPGAWAVAGAGVVGLATGVVLGLLANSKHSAAVGEPDVGRAESLQSTARGLATGATWTLVVSGVVAAGGVAWIGYDLVRPLPAPAPSGAMVVVHGTF